MSQDIRSFFKRTPGKSQDSNTNTESVKSKKRYIVDSDSDDDFRSPKTKKNKTSQETTPKSNKKTSPNKKSTSKYFEVGKSTVDSMFGKEPVKRSKEKNEKASKKLKDDFDDTEFASALIQIDDASDEEWIKEKSFASSGYGSQIPSSQSQGSNVGSSPKPNTSSIKLSSPQKMPVKKKSPTKVSPVKVPRKIENVPSLKESSHKNGSSPCSKASVRDDRSAKNATKTIPCVSPMKKKNEDIKAEIKFSPVKRDALLVSGLWVDKYKPSNIKQIIGQQGEKSNVNKLLKWLKAWYVNQSGTVKLTKPSPWAKDDSGAYFKAALLSGPPGVGKTTTAHLVCKELEMDMVEFNASDTRSKKLLNQEVGELLTSKSLSPFFGDRGEVTKKHVLVMDEVDGMAGNEDRGGVQELIQLIKNSKVPIICMCNDRNHPKIRSLANYCFDLRFQKPRPDQIKGAMLSVCFKEKLKIKPDVLMDVIVNTNQDIRLILNHLSMLAASSSDDMKASTKDIKMGPWDVLKKVFSEDEHKKMSIHDKSDLFFHDYSIAPLFVQENYLSVVPHSQGSKTKLGKIQLFAKAAESIANGDLIDKAIRSSSAWSLLPTQAMFSSLIPGELLEGHIASQINFPSWLGKNSKKNKMDRLTQEIQSHTRLRMSGSKEDVILDYSKALYDAIVRPLSQLGSEGTESALDVMKEYSLLREDIDSLSQLADWNFRPDPFSRLESKVKAAFTRAYNKHPVMSPFAQISAVKTKSKGGGEDWGGSEEESEVSDEEGDINTDAMILAKKKPTKEKAPSSKPEASTTGGSKRGGGRGGGRGGKRGKK